MERGTQVNAGGRKPAERTLDAVAVGQITNVGETATGVVQQFQVGGTGLFENAMFQDSQEAVLTRVDRPAHLIGDLVETGSRREEAPDPEGKREGQPGSGPVIHRGREV